MRTVLVLLFAGSLVAAAPVPKAVKKQDDATLLEGQWEVATCDSGNGPRVEAGDDSTFFVEFNNGRLTTGTATKMGYVARPFKLNPDANPKHLDIDDLVGGFHLGIYEVSGDTLTRCVTNSTTTRPTEFKVGNGRHCFVYKRAKSKE